MSVSEVAFGTDGRLMLDSVHLLHVEPPIAYILVVTSQSPRSHAVTAPVLVFLKLIS